MMLVQGRRVDLLNTLSSKFYERKVSMRMCQYSSICMMSEAAILFSGDLDISRL